MPQYLDPKTVLIYRPHPVHIVRYILIKHYDYLQAGCNSFIYQEGDFYPKSAISETVSSYYSTAYTNSEHKSGLCGTVS